MADPISVRMARPIDAPALIQLQRQIATETTFMLLEPGEVPSNPKGLAAHLADIEKRDNTAWFVAERGGETVGYLGADDGRLARNRASARIFLGVLEACWGQGVARALFQAVAVFLGAAWVVLQVIDLLTERLGLPEWVFPTALVLLAVGLLVVLEPAWVQIGRAHV